VDGRRVPVRDRACDIVRVGPTELGRAVLALWLAEGEMMASYIFYIIGSLCFLAGSAIGLLQKVSQ